MTAAVRDATSSRLRLQLCLGRSVRSGSVLERCPECCVGSASAPDILSELLRMRTRQGHLQEMSSFE